MLTILLIVLVASRANRFRTVVIWGLVIQGITALLLQNPLHLLILPVYLIIARLVFNYRQKKLELLVYEDVSGIKQKMPLSYRVLGIIGRTILIIIILMGGFIIYSLISQGT